MGGREEEDEKGEEEGGVWRACGDDELVDVEDDEDVDDVDDIDDDVMMKNYFLKVKRLRVDVVKHEELGVQAAQVMILILMILMMKMIASDVS